MATFRITIDGKKVGRQIQSQIEDGVDSAADEINDEMRKIATRKVRTEKAVFSRELLTGFQNSKHTFGDSTVASLRNISQHAPYQERGVSGTQVSRNTPYKYKDKKPPLAALIPWVVENLQGSFWPDETLGANPNGDGGSNGSTSSRSSGSTGSGGTQIDDTGVQNHDPLMGADELEIGTEVSAYSEKYGYLSGPVMDVLDDDHKFDYSVYATVNGEDGFVGVRYGEIEKWDGKGIAPEAVEEGLKVYVGEENQVGIVTNVLTHDGKVTGAQIDLDGDGQWDDSLDLWQFEELLDAPNYQNGIPLDENKLYLPEDGFSVRGITDEFDVPQLFPNQRVVVYNTKYNEYERGTIREFGDSDQSFKFELDATGGSLFNIDNQQNGPWRLAGTENWDDLTESDQKDRLRDYFDDFIATGYKDILTPSIRTQHNLKGPDQSTINTARDIWTEAIFDRFDSTELVKEQVRNLTGIVGYEDAEVKANKGRGGSIADLDGTTRFFGVFLSDKQFLTISRWDTTDREMILSHESKHALTSVMRLSRPSVELPETSKLIRDTDWDANGVQNTSDFPNHAENWMFHDRDNGNTVLGGTSWLKDAYYAADSGKSGIRGYTPNLQTGRDEPYKRLHEAANHAWWLQAIGGKKVLTDTGDMKKVNTSELFIRSPYSAKNASETLATLEEIMGGYWDGDIDWEERLEYLTDLYPWLIEAWLEGHSPPQRVIDVLESLGWTL
jgi:hypothetical protein